MRKILVISLCLILLLSFVGCSNNNDGNNDVKCTNCGANINTNAKFCSECGTIIGDKPDNEVDTFECSNCGELNVNNAKFCSSCGVKFNDSNKDELTDNTNSEVTDSISPEDTQNTELIKESIKIYGTYIDVDSADGVNVRIQWENLCEKEIKHIYFYIELYNRVDEIVSCDISDETTKMIQQLGPIPKGKGMYNCPTASSTSGCKRPFQSNISYEEYMEDKQNDWAADYWDCVWYNRQAHYVKIVGLKIEYMDGSTLSEMNKTSFEKMGIVNLTIKDDVYNYCGKTYN